MTKQKICIIGAGLTGLTTAFMLARCNLFVDLVEKNFKKKQTKTRSVAISRSNYLFLKKFDICKSFEKKFWSINTIKVYTETDSKKQNYSILDFSDPSTNKKIFYMIENIKFQNMMRKKIKSLKNVNILSSKDIKKKYDLIINCTGINSTFTKKIFNKKDTYNKKYNEVSLSLLINHKTKKNNAAEQFFFKEGPLAILPISNTKTSIVWSVNKKFTLNKNLIKKKLKLFLLKKYKLKSMSPIEFNDLNFNLAKKYYYKRILNFGDILHLVHPFVGQGFNMTLRDVMSLEAIIKNKISLGLDVGSLETLNEFLENSKARNYLFANGIDYLRNFFLSNNVLIKNFKNISLHEVNKKKYIKNLFLNLADKGLYF